MNIGFFADDMSASHAAILAGSGFRSHDTGSPSILAGSNALARAVPDYLDAARTLGDHLMVALPLAQLGNAGIRTRVDLAVITFGPGLVARDAAFRAMAHEHVSTASAVTPSWMLAAAGPPRKEPPRTLPVRMTMLRSPEATDLRLGCTCGMLHRRAIALAAALRIAADDPYASRIDPAEIAAILSTDAASETLSGAEAMLREDLLDLAADLDRGPGPPHGTRGDRRRLIEPGRHPVLRTRRLPMGALGKRATAPKATVRHSADCNRIAIA